MAKCQVDFRFFYDYHVPNKVLPNQDQEQVQEPKSEIKETKEIESESKDEDFTLGGKLDTSEQMEQLYVPLDEC